MVLCLCVTKQVGSAQPTNIVEGFLTSYFPSDISQQFFPVSLRYQKLELLILPWLLGFFQQTLDIKDKATDYPCTRAWTKHNAADLQGRDTFLGAVLWNNKHNWRTFLGAVLGKKNKLAVPTVTA
eukprot:gb/GEZN01016555.1/.p1 GENE.gb/GEZN01016555.1/~~gb/GEZN01016555.1/.p1  ORF type:complete len:125 (+),score=8.78 gb/GEZN01016555.1/:178-552(+)